MTVSEQLYRVTCYHFEQPSNQGIAGNWWSSSQYNANNAWNLNNGSLNNNNKNNSNSVLPVFEVYYVVLKLLTNKFVTMTQLEKELNEFNALAEYQIKSRKDLREYNFIPFSLVIEAYLDCCKHKRSKHACVQFGEDALKYLELLWRELDEQKYEIGYSNAFIVTRPKLREVFAADFRDRIAHHLLMLLVMNVFEENFIPDSYNCRKGKGTLYGIQRVRDMILEMSNNYHEKCYVLKCDLKGFFMHINKDIMWNTVSKVIVDGYKGDISLDWILWLTKKIIYHRPETLCHINSPKEMWLRLDPDKSLFTNGDNLGMAIGNLTSQIFANTYLTPFDKFVISHPEFKYGRYVDDFVIICKDKNRLLKFINEMKAFLKENMHVDLHPHKIYCQEVKKGVSFTGCYIKYGKIFPTARLYGNFENFLRSPFDGDLEHYIARYNSYMGFLSQSPTYNYRRRMYEDMLPTWVKKRTYVRKNYAVLAIKPKYSKRAKLINKIYKQSRMQFSQMHRYMNQKKWSAWTLAQTELTQLAMDNANKMLEKKSIRQNIQRPTNNDYMSIFVYDEDGACYRKVWL